MRRRGLSVVPREPARRGAARRRTSSQGGDWEDTSTGSYARYGDYHWVHAINNTALVAAALTVRRRLLGRDLGGRPGRLDTDTNGAAVGSVVGALPGRRDRGALVAPLAAASRARSRASTAGSVDELVQRTIARRSREPPRHELPLEKPRDPCVATADRPADAPCRSSGADLDELDTREDLAAPDDPPNGRPGGALRAGARRRSSGSATTIGLRPRRSSPGRAGASRSRSRGSGTSALRPRRPGRFTPERFFAERRESSAASTASCSGTPIR